MRPSYLDGLSIVRCACCDMVLPPFFFFFNVPATTDIYTLSLHDALPISLGERHPDEPGHAACRRPPAPRPLGRRPRSEEHTSELQSRVDLVCRLLLEKKKINEHR